MNCLIVGGTSGLGLSIATQLVQRPSHQVTVTGRRGLQQDGIDFRPLDLSDGSLLAERIGGLTDGLPHVDLLIYAAGYYQEGRITEIYLDEIQSMLSVGLVGAMYLTRSLLEKQGELGCVVSITSTSQWTPREKEPVYTAVKAGLAAFTNSLSLDPRVKKGLVIGPAGMATSFWEGTEKDTSDMLNPDWVAHQTLELIEGEFSYKYARILREPARVELQEVRW